MNRKGFTLLELMIVIVIIGILASLALPRFMGARTRAYKVEAVQVLSELKTLGWGYNLEQCTGTIGTNSLWPTTWGGFGYASAPNTPNWTFALTTTTANGNLVITASGIAGTPTASSPDVVLAVTPAGASTVR